MLWLKCEYMLDKLGETFPGIISGVTSFGFFVTLENIWVDGLVHVASLPNDYYTFDPSTQSLVAERAGKRFRLGDKIKVQVTRVDLDERKVDLEVV
jgi:ribonuclease R